MSDPLAATITTMGARLTVVAMLAVLVGCLTLAVTRPETFWSLDGPSLEASLEDEFGYEVENCDRTGDEHWRCDYARDALSGPAGHLRVEQRSDRCWAASTEDKPDPPSQQGCISAWQFFKAM
jgi:hypothetical protein